MNGKKLLRATILTALCMAAMLYVNGTVSKAYWVVVKSNNTRVRNSASTDSEVMTAVNAGDRLDVVSEEQGSDGNTWYKVSINNVSGYVRSDTVEKAAEGDAAATVSTVQPVEATSSSTVEPMTSQAATVNKDNVNVRASASTGADVVAKLQNGAAVTLTGTTSDSSGKTWYQVNFINNGSNVTGFIREDFLEPGEVMEPQTPEEETPEGDESLAEMYGDMPAEDETSNNNDYELFFEADAEGVDCWYIHDNVAQKRYKLEQLMQADEMNANNMEIKNKEVKRLKVILIVLAALLAVALAAAGIFGYKYFSAGYDDDEDDEDDDDFRAAAPARRRVRTEEETGNRRKEAVREEERSRGGTAVRRPDTGAQKRPVNSSAQRRPEGAQPVRKRTEAETQRRSPAGAQGSRSAQPVPQGRRPRAASESDAVRRSSRPDVEWKSKNFLAGDEDGLDFSFINGNDEDV